MMQRKRVVLLSLALLCVALGSVTAWSADIAGYTPKSKYAKQMVVRLGPDEKAPEMLVVLDSSKSEEVGFDLAVADTNLNGKLSDDPPIQGALSGLRGAKGSERCDLQIPIVAPFGTVDHKAKYNIELITYAAQNQDQIALAFGCVQFTKDGAEYAYLTIGKGQPDAKNPDVTRLWFGSPMKLEVKGQSDGTTLSVSSTIKDTLGQVLRTASKSGKEIVPHLKVTAPSGKVIVDQDMRYG